MHPFFTETEYCVSWYVWSSREVLSEFDLHNASSSHVHLYFAEVRNIK